MKPAPPSVKTGCSSRTALRLTVEAHVALDGAIDGVGYLAVSVPGRIRRWNPAIRRSSQIGPSSGWSPRRTGPSTRILAKYAGAFVDKRSASFGLLEHKRPVQAGDGSGSAPCRSPAAGTKPAPLSDRTTLTAAARVRGRGVGDGEALDRYGGRWRGEGLVFERIETSDAGGDVAVRAVQRSNGIPRR